MSNNSEKRTLLEMVDRLKADFQDANFRVLDECKYWRSTDENEMFYIGIAQRIAVGNSKVMKAITGQNYWGIKCSAGEMYHVNYEDIYITPPMLLDAEEVNLEIVVRSLGRLFEAKAGKK